MYGQVRSYLVECAPDEYERRERGKVITTVWSVGRVLLGIPEGWGEGLPRHVPLFPLPCPLY